MFQINLLAVIVSAVVAFVIGFLLHGPVLGKLWMKLADVHPTGNETFSNMLRPMAFNLLVNFLSALGLAIFNRVASYSGMLGGNQVGAGVAAGLIVWFFFNNTATVIDVIWMGKKFSLWLFECLASLIVFIAMGAVIGAWA